MGENNRRTEQGYQRTGQSNQRTGQSNQRTGKSNQRTGQSNQRAGQGNHRTGQSNQREGQGNHITEQGYQRIGQGKKGMAKEPVRNTENIAIKKNAQVTKKNSSQDTIKSKKGRKGNSFDLNNKGFNDNTGYIDSEAYLEGNLDKLDYELINKYLKPKKSVKSMKDNSSRNDRAAGSQIKQHKDYNNEKDRARAGKPVPKKIGSKDITRITDKAGIKDRTGATGKTGNESRCAERKVGFTRNNDNDMKALKSNHVDNKPAVKGACPYIRDCGGCNILLRSYAAELNEKQKTVEKLLNKYCKIEQIIGMKDPSHYRNKVHVVFDHDKKGNPISGVYEEGTHRVISVKNCMIHDQKADAIIATIRGMLKSFKIKTYDEDTGYGLLRHVLIRTGFSSKEIMVVLVLASPILPSKNNFVKALREKHPEITTIVINVNDKSTSMVLGEKEHVIYGKGYIEDSLCGKVFRISSKSFYQVNPAQTEVLYGKAIEMAQLSGSETVIDAYCGTGTIGIIASDHSKRVIGVELNKDAVRDANMNAKLNDTQNIEFYNNDAGVFMSQMAAKNETADVVFMDPPRTGSSEQFMDALAILKPKKVVYVSCNPVTLERDLQYLTKKGYKAVKAVPVDMFPWTGHVETVCLMSRKDK